MPRLATCDCNECAKCKRRLYMVEWYRRPGVAERVRATARASRQRRLEDVREYDRRRGFRVYDPEKVKARNAARVVPPQPCEVCGEHAERHHDDYSKPLEVRWLCRRHHGEAHRKVAA